MRYTEEQFIKEASLVFEERPFPFQIEEVFPMSDALSEIQDNKDGQQSGGKIQFDVRWKYCGHPIITRLQDMRLYVYNKLHRSLDTENIHNRYSIFSFLIFAPELLLYTLLSLENYLYKIDRAPLKRKILSSLNNLHRFLSWYLIFPFRSKQYLIDNYPVSSLRSNILLRWRIKETDERNLKIKQTIPNA